MLRQMDQHSEELKKHSAELKKQSAELTKQSQRSDVLWTEQRAANAQLFQGLDEFRQRLRDQDGVISQNQQMALQTAAILDRIIKKNALKL